MSTPESQDAEKLVTRHLRGGFVALAIFIIIGAVLEGFHAVKSPLYLDAGNETTRLLLRLAHAHGTLLSILNILYAVAIKTRDRLASPFASNAVVLALILLPAGFLIGGLSARGADPGLGIILVPIGAIALVAFAITAARRS